MGNWWQGLRKDWKSLTRPSKAATILSVVAIIVTMLNGILSWRESARQNEINSGIATFAANAQGTSAAQLQNQIALQSTQIAMQNQMDRYAQWQITPSVQIANELAQVLVLENV